MPYMRYAVNHCHTGVYEEEIVAAWLRLKVGRRSRVGEGMVGAVGRVGVGNGCRVWLRWSDYRGMGEVEG